MQSAGFVPEFVKASKSGVLNKKTDVSSGEDETSVCLRTCSVTLYGAKISERRYDEDANQVLRHFLNTFAYSFDHGKPFADIVR